MEAPTFELTLSGLIFAITVPCEEVRNYISTTGTGIRAFRLDLLANAKNQGVAHGLTNVSATLGGSIRANNKITWTIHVTGEPPPAPQPD